MASEPDGVAHVEADGFAHLADIETALHREVEILCYRFPDADQVELERRVRDTYARLLNGAAFETHILSLTRARVTDALLAKGLRAHSRTANLI